MSFRRTSTPAFTPLKTARQVIEATAKHIHTLLDGPPNNDSSSIPACTVLRLAPSTEPIRGHIGDLPNDVLARILTWKLLANEQLSTVVNFVRAAPFLAQKAGHAGGINLLVACSIDETHVS